MPTLTCLNVADEPRNARTKLARYGDHAGTHRLLKLADLTRMELVAYGCGDPNLGRLSLHPGRLVEALDRYPHVPTSGIWVERPRTVKEFCEAIQQRNKRYDEKTDEERVISMATSDAIDGGPRVWEYVQNVVEMRR